MPNVRLENKKDKIYVWNTGKKKDDTYVSETENAVAEWVHERKWTMEHNVITIIYI